MKHLSSLLMLVFSALYSVQARAQSPLLPSQSRVTAGIMLVDTSYQLTNDNNNFDAQGTMLFGGYQALINNRFSVGGVLGLLADGSTSGDVSTNNGTGFRLALNADFEAAKIAGNSLIGSVAFMQDRFTFSQNGFKLALTTTELDIAGLIRHRMKTLTFYGGLQIFLLDNDTATVSGGGAASYTSDVSRQDRFDLRLGATIDVTPTLDMRLDLFLFGEQSILIGADFKV